MQKIVLNISYLFCKINCFNNIFREAIPVHLDQQGVILVHHPLAGDIQVHHHRKEGDTQVVLHLKEDTLVRHHQVVILPQEDMDNHLNHR